MPISTTDVVTNIISDNEIIKNGTTVVYCQRTGEFSKLDSTYETSIGYTGLEAKYTNRFYPNIDSFRVVDGGNP